VVPVSLEADSRVRDAALCSFLTQSARSALALGYLTEAAALLDEALSYVPSDPDGNYYRALVGLTQGDTPATAISRMEIALAGGAFNLIKKDEASLLFATLLVRTHRAQEALRFLSSIPPSAQALYVETRALLAMGDESRAGQALQASLQRYPLDPRALLAWLRWRDRPYVSADGSKIVLAGFKALGTLKEVDPGVLVALAPYAENTIDARLLVREFRAMGNKSADATILALEYGLISEAKAISEMLSGDYAPTVRAMRSLDYLLSSDESKALFAASFKVYSGTISGDDDRDDFPETATTYRFGLPESWVLDQNQDGVPEMWAKFLNGVPHELSTSSGTMTVRIRYSVWPYASNVEFVDQDFSRMYSIGDSILPLAVLGLPGMLQGNPPAARAVIRGDVPLPMESTVASVAFAHSLTSADASRTVELFEGIPVRAWWNEQNGQAGYLVYNNGVPENEILDMDGDGRFESRRIWTRSMDGAAEPAYLEADLDGDGLFEYRESVLTPLVQSWDHNGDGRFDTTIEKRNDGTVVHRFTANQNPLRWVEVVIAGGRIESAMEGGERIPLILDSGGIVTWVGKKPFDFGAVRPDPGYGSRDGTIYILTTIDGALYAQILE
jgi:tetratricopeptide (TPR) repeat protein